MKFALKLRNKFVCSSYTSVGRELPILGRTPGKWVFDTAYEAHVAGSSLDGVPPTVEKYEAEEPRTR